MVKAMMVMVKAMIVMATTMKEEGPTSFQSLNIHVSG